MYILSYLGQKIQSYFIFFHDIRFSTLLTVPGNTLRQAAPVTCRTLSENVCAVENNRKEAKSPAQGPAKYSEISIQSKRHMAVLSVHSSQEILLRIQLLVE